MCFNTSTQAQAIPPTSNKENPITQLEMPGHAGNLPPFHPTAEWIWQGPELPIVNPSPRRREAGHQGHQLSFALGPGQPRKWGWQTPAPAPLISHPLLAMFRSTETCALLLLLLLNIKNAICKAKHTSRVKLWWCYFAFSLKKPVLHRIRVSLKHNVATTSPP